MLTIVPSSGPSERPDTGTGVGGISGRTRGVGIHGEAGASALALRIGNAGESLLEPVTGGPLHRYRCCRNLCFGWSN